MTGRNPTVFSLVILLVAGAAWATQNAPVGRPTKAADDGQSLKSVMKFIQDTMNEQGHVARVQSETDLAGMTYRVDYILSDVVADPTACSLRTSESIRTDLELDAGVTYSDPDDGKPVTGDDLHYRTVVTGTIFLKDVEQTEIENMRDRTNREFAEGDNPGTRVTMTPEVFSLWLFTSKPVFSFHRSFTQGKQPPHDYDFPVTSKDYTFRDQETANRVSQALTRAIELCGGGRSKDPF